jgi:NAD-dependent DNA ligase
LADKHQYNRVGYQVTDAIPHVYRMYSLKKCFDLDDAPLAVDECIETPKLDGAAVSLLYVEGLLQLALTRGDGIQGRLCHPFLIVTAISIGGINGTISNDALGGGLGQCSAD